MLAIKRGPFIAADGGRMPKPPPIALTGSISWEKLIELLQGSQWCDGALETVAWVRIEDHGLSIFYNAKPAQ